MSWFPSSPPPPKSTDDATLSSSGFSESIPEYDVPETTKGAVDTLHDAAAPETPPGPQDSYPRGLAAPEPPRHPERDVRWRVWWRRTWTAGISKNGLMLTFILGGTGISFLTTRSIIHTSLGEHYAQLKKAQDARTGNLLGDEAIGDTHPVEKVVDARAQLARDLSNIGTPRERTRWTKGRGLEGEVEEEDELRDTYIRPGVPRNI
ncbi:hypothetical protein CcaverHIS631_0508620 [Cutaneotrichosporon cavernicola]|nr:hypothetical protein CcaverHIS631_0508620 [Cutaneotrichosporon cavernicola]